MKKITLWLFVLFTSWQISAQTCNQTFTASGQDDGPVVLTINAADINCYGANPVTSLKLENAAGSLTSGFCTNDGSSWYGFDLSIDGGPIVTGCAAAFNDVVITGFTTLTITSHDDDNWSDTVAITIDVEATFTALLPPSCVTLSSPANGALNISSNVISWPLAGGGATGYKIKVGTSSGGFDVANMDDLGNVTSYTIDEMEAGTTYYITVVPYNANGDAVGCTESIFTTCDSNAVPYTEEFEGITTGIPSCWGLAGTTTNANYHFTSFATGNIGRGLRFDSYINANGLTSELTTPVIDASTVTSLRLKFYYKNPTGGNFEVLVSNDGGTTYTSLETNLTGTTAWTIKSYDLTSYINDNIKVKFKGTSNYGNGDAYVYLDGVVFEEIPAGAPACVVVASPVNGAVNISNPTITWAANVDATGYKILVGSTPGGFDVANMDDLGNVTSYTIDETEPGTTYYVTVFPYNASGTATGCVESSFTVCDGFGDFTENLDALTGTGQIPSCWSKILSNGVTAFATVGTSGTNNSAPYSIELYNSGSPAAANMMLVTPYINNIDAGTNRLKFFARNSTATQDIEVGTMSDPADASTFTVLQTVDINGTFAEYSVSFAGYTGTDKYIAFRRLSTATYTYVYIDNIVWEAIPAVPPTCVAITSPVTGATNVMNSNVTWASNADATGYKISVGTGAGLTDVLNLQDVGNVLNYSFPTEAGVTYYVTVYPYNTFGQPATCTEISFTTCDSLTPNVLETFGTFLPACWQEAENGDLVAGPAAFGTGAWQADGFSNNGTVGAIKINIDYLEDNDWVISPVIEVPAVGYELKFDAAATQWNGTGAPTTPWDTDDYIQVLVSSTGTTNWTALFTYNNTNQPSNTGNSNVINLDAYAGQNVRFAFRGVEGAVDGAADIDFFIDNFEVRLTPATAPLCATNVVATPNACGNFANAITWDASAGADGYRINVGTVTGGTDIANNVDLGNVLTYSLTGTIGTTYYYTLIPYNGVGPATGCTEMSFDTAATGCYCVPTYTYGIASGDLISNIEIVGTTLSNNSGTATTGASYTFFTGQPNYTASLQAGSTYNVSVTVGSFGGQNLAAWVDYNDNYIFEPSERIGFTTTSIAANGTATFSITLACNPPLGNHRLRIRDVWNTNGNLVDPCANYGWGETEDYVVTITSAVACPAPSALTATAITTSGATLGWTLGCSETVWDLHVDVAGAGAPTTTISNEAITSSSLMVSTLSDNTAYEFYVRANCGGTDGTSTWVGPFAFTTLSLPPANDNCASAQVLTPGGVFAENAVVGTNVGATNSNETAPTCTILGEEVWYSVTVPASGNITIECDTNTGTAITDTGLAVYSGTCGALTQVECDDDDGNGAFSKVILTGRTPGEVLLVSVWEYGGDLTGTFKVSAYDASLSSNTFDNANFKAYPNPVKDILNLSYTSEISSVRIINLLGQEVISSNVNATSTQIDMSQLSAGAYIVNVTVGDTTKTLKVVKQ